MDSFSPSMVVKDLVKERIYSVEVARTEGNTSRWRVLTERLSVSFYSRVLGGGLWEEKS